ncbi:hypothetical protein [Mesorhizobium sp. WSM2240]|uniref:Uncharacterized protein n=2 Tax=unclassified Mesorhizobium TaxID=325217 RepID=A0AAU8DAT6_9HYPH
MRDSQDAWTNQRAKILQESYIPLIWKEDFFNWLDTRAGFVHIHNKLPARAAKKNRPICRKDISSFVLETRDGCVGHAPFGSTRSQERILR